MNATNKPYIINNIKVMINRKMVIAIPFKGSILFLIFDLLWKRPTDARYASMEIMTNNFKVYGYVARCT